MSWAKTGTSAFYYAASHNLQHRCSNFSLKSETLNTTGCSDKWGCRGEPGQNRRHQAFKVKIRSYIWHRHRSLVKLVLRIYDHFFISWAQFHHEIPIQNDKISLIWMKGHSRLIYEISFNQSMTSMKPLSIVPLYYSKKTKRMVTQSEGKNMNIPQKAIAHEY